MYELMGRAHAWLAQERGQGTVEYVGLLLLLAAVMTAIVAASGNLKVGVAQSVVDKIKSTIDSVGAKG